MLNKVWNTMTYTRSIYKKLSQRAAEPRKFIQVLTGPRQVGKTTLVKQLLKDLDYPSMYASADLPTIKDIPWLEQQWELARLAHAESKHPKGILLVLDEIQKVPHWSEKIKQLWDQDTYQDINVKVMLLGSSPLLIQKGLTETLAGRFEMTFVTHWSFLEMKEAFDWDLSQYIYFGGYPGAADFIYDEKRWADYINQSLIETSISRDILLMTRVDKPALLRRLFELGCHYSGQILSYQKMLGQLADAGNATTLVHYLTLLDGAGMLTGLNKFSGKVVMQKASIPKLQIYNTALMSAQRQMTFETAMQDKAYWGRLVESAVGAQLLNQGIVHDIKISYWRDRNKEVDFVLQQGEKIVPVEVKSSFQHKPLSGMLEFSKKYNTKRLLLVGGDGITLDKFFCTELDWWLQD